MPRTIMILFMTLSQIPCDSNLGHDLKLETNYPHIHDSKLLTLHSPALMIL